QPRPDMTAFRVKRTSFEKKRTDIQSMAEQGTWHWGTTRRLKGALGHQCDHIDFYKHSRPRELANVDECVSRKRRLAICSQAALPCQLLMARVDDIGHLFDNVGHGGSIAGKDFLELAVGVPALRGKVAWVTEPIPARKIILAGPLTVTASEKRLLVQRP